MPLNLTTVLAASPVNKTEAAPNTNGLYALTVTLANQSDQSPFLLESIRAYATTEGIKLKEDRHNSYLSVYLVPALEAGVGALDRATAVAGSSTTVTKRVQLANLVQSQDGSDLYRSFSIGGLPAGRQYKLGFELVVNGVVQPDWIAPVESITIGGTGIAPPAVSLIVEEDGDAIKVTVDSLDTTDTSAFLLEVIDTTKAAMPELDYDDSVVLVSKFTFDPASKPVFVYSPYTDGMRKYVPYDIRIRARKTAEGFPDSASDGVIATTSSFTLPWLRDFVNNTVIRGRQIEESLVTALAQKVIDNDEVRAALRTALNTGSYSNVAETMYDLSRDVAVTDFAAMGAKFDAVRERLLTISLYSEIDSEYGEMLDLTDPEMKEAFAFITKRGYAGSTPTNYFSWLDKAFHLGPVVELGEIAVDKYHVTVRGSVYRDRAEIVFS